MQTDFHCGKLEVPQTLCWSRSPRTAAKGEPEQCKSALLFRHIKGKLTFVQSIAGTQASDH